MRINVYAEESTTHVSVETKTADTGNEFKGIRFYLESSEKLHRTPKNDDSSAVTFWIKGSKNRGYNVDILIRMFKYAIENLELIGNK